MHHVVSSLEMAELDRQTISDYLLPGRVLMEIAGRAVADLCQERMSEESRVVIACGRGNNGGDGFVCARALSAQGHQVEVFVFGTPADIDGEAHEAFRALLKCQEVITTHVEDAKKLVEFGEAISHADLVVDALLGIGVQGEVRGLIADAIDIICECAAPVVAVDIPSGICADTGSILGRAVPADITVAMAFAKRGHFLHPGAEMRGELIVADIGVPKALADRLSVMGKVVHASDGPALFPKRSASAHKGTFGRVTIVAGSKQTPGAALLALRGALRGGAGTVYWGVHERVLDVAPAWPAEVILRPTDFSNAERWAEDMLRESSALVIGPGLSIEPQSGVALSTLLRQATIPLCLDADALNLIARDPKLWQHLKAPTVITPHPKEMARLMGCDVHDVQKDRFAAASHFAMSKGCVVVLKGAGTVIGSPDGTTAIIDAGDVSLATGGSGDVLAGLIGALLAQGLDPSSAAILGALWHGAAGEAAGKRYGHASTTAGDVADALADIGRQWQV